MKPIEAIKKYFEQEPNGRNVTVAELKDLSKTERQELGKLCCEALSEEFEAT